MANQQNSTVIYRGDQAEIAEQKRKAAADAATELNRLRTEYVTSNIFNRLWKKWKYESAKRRYDATVAVTQQQG